MILRRWRRWRHQDAQIQQLIDAVVAKEAEAAILAEVLDRLGVRPLNGQSVRDWAQARVARLQSGEWSTIDQALSDWDGRAEP